jgi:hypothetical protein
MGFIFVAYNFNDSALWLIVFLPYEFKELFSLEFARFKKFLTRKYFVRIFRMAIVKSFYCFGYFFEVGHLSTLMFTLLLKQISV